MADEKKEAKAPKGDAPKGEGAPKGDGAKAAGAKGGGGKPVKKTSKGASGLSGPVQTERGFVLHERIDGDGGHYNSSLQIPGGLEMTTSKDVLEAMAVGNGPRRVLVTLGYSGWATGQLEDELGRNGWLNVDAAPEIIFDTPVEQRYERALALLGIDPRMLSQEAGHA